MKHLYTSAPLPPDSPAHVARTPGARDVVRLFPEPRAAEHGSLGVEGGITLVAGPGMGRTTVLGQVQAALERERRIPSARVELPVQASDAGFYSFVGALASGARDALARSRCLAEPEHAPLRAALAQPLPFDVTSDPAALSVRGLQSWITELGRAAAQGRGCCLLFDGLDAVAQRDWASALVAGLRFTFQAAGGVTPIFALWDLYFEESLPGSNYFRNVTRPIFISPLSAAPAGTSERDQLIDVSLAGLGAPARAAAGAIAGGHPGLLQATLAALAERVDAAALPGLDAATVRALLAPARPELRDRAAALLARVPQLQSALRRLAEESVAHAALPRALLTAGLVDLAADGRATLPECVRDALD